MRYLRMVCCLLLCIVWIHSCAILPAFADNKPTATPKEEKAADTAMESRYNRGLRLMYSGKITAAASTFCKLGDYRCSADYLKYCTARMEADDSSSTPALEGIIKQVPIGAGTWYGLREAVVYLPDEIDSSTKCILYYPGGNGAIMEGGVPSLFSYSVRDYLNKYSPSSILVLWRSSGWYQLTPTIEKSYQLLEQIVRERGIVIHDLVLAGSSNGGYTAVKAASYLLEEHGVPAASALVYDMGVSFAVNILPSAEEYQNIARAETKLIFFDQREITYENPHIQEMTENGVDVQLIYCVKDEHNHITWDGFSLGTLSWATGELDSISSDAYVFAKKTA